MLVERIFPRAGVLIALLVTMIVGTLVSVTGDANAAAGHSGQVTTNGDRLTMRSSPKPDSKALGTLANKTNVTIVCQMNGTTMNGTFGKGPLWDKLTTGGFVPDIYVFTGSDGRVAPDCPAGSARTLPAGLSFSTRGVEMLKKFEGLITHPYNDDPADPNCTIGYGHLIHAGRCTSADDREYGTISVARATALLRSDVQRFVRGIQQQLPSTPMAQYEFDALVSFSYNIGLGGFQRSAVRDDLIKSVPDYKSVPSHLLNWTNHGVCGLKSRRMNEGTLFSTGSYSTANHC
jgi:GH24 family phage-related lysozyme (muramidase)